VLFHEKPFSGVNGSGKHCNWSLMTDHGENLLEPSPKPESNHRFLLCLLAVLDAVKEHGGLLRAAIASASNDHRLGANEAPPGIISVFLGEQLTEVLNALEEQRQVKNFSRPQITSVKLGGTMLDVKVSTLPGISRDLTDRNRTSPFAFTGNKFEFRAVGSKQSPSFPVTALNSAVATSLRKITAALLEQKGSKAYPSLEDQLVVIRKFIACTKPVRFEGDNYSEAWKEQAQERGLLNITTSPQAFEQLITPGNEEMLTKTLHIFSKAELHSRYHIMVEKYVKDLLIEAEILQSLVKTNVLPAAFTYRHELATSASALKHLELDAKPETLVLKGMAPVLLALQEQVNNLAALTERIKGLEEPKAAAELGASELVPVMRAIRGEVDKLEEVVPDKHWSLPKYTELLLTV